MVDEAIGAQEKDVAVTYRRRNARHTYTPEFADFSFARSARLSALFAVEQIAHYAAALCVQPGVCFHGAGAQRGLAKIRGFSRFTALWAAIGESRLVRPQFELFPAKDTGFDRKRHCIPMITRVIALARPTMWFTSLRG